VLAVIDSTVISAFKGLKKITDANLLNIPGKSLMLVIISFIAIPIFFSSIAFLKENLFKKFLVSWYCSAYFYTFILFPFVLGYFLFEISENYFFFFVYYIFFIWALIYLLIYVPLILNTGIRKLLSLFITLAAYVAVTAILYFSTTYLSFDNKVLPSIEDPIMGEFVEKEVFQNSRLDYLIGNAIIIRDSFDKYLKYQKQEDFTFLKQNIEGVLKLKNDYKKYLDKLEFRSNKKVIEIALEYIEELEKIQIQIARIEVSSSYVKKAKIMNAEIQDVSLKPKNTTERIAKLHNDLLAIGETIDTLEKGVTMYNSSVTESNNLLKEINSTIKKMNEAIKEKTNWIKFKNSFWFLP